MAVPATLYLTRVNMLSPLAGTLAALVHRLTLCISWLLGGNLRHFVLHLRPCTPGRFAIGTALCWLVRLRALTRVSRLRGLERRRGVSVRRVSVVVRAFWGRRVHMPPRP